MMIDVNANLLPDKTIRVANGSIVDYIFSATKPHPLPDTNTRLVAISESDLALILAMLDESQADYLPLAMTTARLGSRVSTVVTVPNNRQADYSVGDVVYSGASEFRVDYVGMVDDYDLAPRMQGIARALLRERLAIVRERLMVDLTQYLERIAASIEAIEEELGDATDSLERVAVAIESQTTTEGLDDIASAVGALAPLVALI
jgi:hypothetical protein